MLALKIQNGDVVGILIRKIVCVKYVESCVCWCVSFMCKVKVEVLCVFGFQRKKRRVSPASTHVPDSPAQPRNGLHEHALFLPKHTHTRARSIVR